MSHELSNIPVTEIAPPRVMLALVDKDSLDYLELKHSIRDEGILQTLTVRKWDGKYPYQLVNGVKRFSVAQDLHFETVPCIMMGEMSTSDVIVKQIQENCCRHKLQPLELSLHFKRLLLLQPDLTFDDIAMMVHKSPTWVRQVLHLQELAPIAKRLMDDQAISMSVATVLSRLPHSIQEDLIDSSLQLEPKEFLQECRQIRKAFKKATSEGKLITRGQPLEEKPAPRLRPLPDLHAEFHSTIYGVEYIKQKGLTPIDIWKEAIAWTLRMDAESIRRHQENIKTREAKRIEGLTRLKDDGSVIGRVKQLNIDIDSDLKRLSQEFLI